MIQNRTSSIAFPNLFDVARNRVSVYEGDRSIVNRTRLLMLSDPTSLYNNPTFGVGLSRYLWQYNTKNTQAIIQDRIKEQLAEHEPAVIAEDTSFADGLLFTNDGSDIGSATALQQLKMTVGLKSIYNNDLDLNIDISAEQAKLFNNQEG